MNKKQKATKPSLDVSTEMKSSKVIGKAEPKKPQVESTMVTRKPGKIDAKNQSTKEESKKDKKPKKGEADKRSTSPEKKHKKVGKGKDEEENDKGKKPPRAVSSYLYYTTEQIPLVKETQKLSHKEAFSQVAGAWGKLTEQQKQPYTDLANKDKARYEKQRKEFEVKGYYTLEDGSKSTDLDKPGDKRKPKDDKPTAGKKTQTRTQTQKQSKANKKDNSD